MKKSLLFLLAISILLISAGGCSKKEEAEKVWAEPPRQKDTMYIYYPQWTYHHMIESEITEWESYIHDKYGMKINLTYTDSMTQKLYSGNSTPTPLPEDSEITNHEKPEDIVNLEELSDFEGFVYVHDFTTLNKLIEYDLIVPVEQYITQIPFYSSVSPEIIESFTDSFNRTWAFPVSVLPPYTYRRVYNKEWLEKARMAVPTTLEEFYEFAKYISNEDPDGNEKKDTYITQFTPTTSEHDFHDIFRAFGCYVANDSLICYNPHSEKYECAFINENFIESMNYIKLLWDEDLIKYVSTKDWYDRVEWSHKIASSFNNVLLTDIEAVDRAYGLYLTGYNETRLIELRNRAYSMAVLKHTENVGKTINQFFTMMQSSPDSRNDLLIGIKGEDYFDYDSHYERIISADSMEPIVSISMYTFLDEDTYYGKPTLSVTSDKLGTIKEVDSVIENRLEYRKAEELIIPYLGTPMAYQNPFGSYTPELLSLNRRVSNMWINFIKMVFEDEMPLDEAYARLIKIYESYEIQQMIDMLNQ